LDAQLLSLVSLSVGECIDPMDSEDMDDDRFKVDEMPSESRSSPGRHDSTIMAFSRQLTKSSAMSEDPVDLVKVPAKRHSPPNPMPAHTQHRQMKH
jgi:hypothetical protein